MFTRMQTGMVPHFASFLLLTFVCYAKEQEAFLGLSESRDLVISPEAGRKVLIDGQDIKEAIARLESTVLSQTTQLAAQASA